MYQRSFRQPFEDFTKITQKRFMVSSFFYISVIVDHWWSVINFDSFRILFTASSPTHPEKMESLTSQMAEISSIKHTFMTWDQVIA